MLSVPSVVALAFFVGGRIPGALGNHSFSNSFGAGLLVLVCLLLVPLCSVILVAWAITRWANHGWVPGWMVAAAAGNAFVFGWLYRMTTM